MTTPAPTDVTPSNVLQGPAEIYTGDFGATQYGPLFAAICINVFGTLLIYLFLNQKVMKGLTSGAVKG